MPGIYVQDGGATASALGNILGGIAANVGPEAAAKAQLLYQQTQGADIANQTAWELQQAGERAYNQRGGLLSTLGANAQDPNAPSVPGTVASLAQPPAPPAVGPGGRISRLGPSGTPLQDYSGYELLRGDLNPAALTTLSNLGQTAVSGPGSDWTTQTEIAKQKALPYDLSTGQERHIPGGAPPETIVPGPDTTSQTAKAKGADIAVTDANTAFNRGKQATSDAAELDDITKGYDALVNIPDGDITTPGVLEALKAATAATGGRFDFTRFSSKQEAINDLTTRMQAMLGSARAAQGDPALRGSLDVMLKQLDVAKNSAPSFHRMVDAFHRQLQSLQDEGGAANTYLNSNRGSQDETAFRNGTMDSRTRAANDLRRQGFGADAAPQAQLPPADSSTVARARVKLKQANNDPAFRKQLIDAGKANGVDLEAGGF